MSILFVYNVKIVAENKKIKKRIMYACAAIFKFIVIKIKT